MTAPRRMQRRDYTLVLCLLAPLAVAGLAFIGYAAVVGSPGGVVYAAGWGGLPVAVAVMAWLARRDS